MRCLPLLLCLFASLLLRAETVQVGVFNVSPWAYVGADGKARGAVVDFYEREVAPRAGVTLVWHAPTTVARMLEDMRAGRLHLTPLLIRNPERERLVVFGKSVLTQFEPCIAVRPDFKLDAIRSAAELKGLTIAYNVGGAQPELLRAPGVKVERTGVPNWEEANLGKLRLKRVDAAFFFNVITPRYFSHRSGEPIRVLKLPVPAVLMHPAFSPGLDPALRDRLDKAVAASAKRFDQYLEPYLDGTKLTQP